MPVKTAETVKTPAFSYRGFDIPALDVPAELIADLGTGEPAYKLALKSAPLAWKVGLYLVGRDLALGEDDAGALPEPVRQAGRIVYEDCQARKGRGAWHKDAVLFEPEAIIRGSVRPGNGYIAARYFIDIEGFGEKTGEIKTLPDRREERIWVPYGDGRFVVPTMDGAYNPITGTPFETIADRGKAIKRWVDAGLTDKEAEKELSRFYRGNSGVRAVRSWSCDDHGPLCVDLGDEPWDRYSCIGSLAVSSSAERSEAPKNRGFRMITKEQYDTFIKYEETVKHIMETLK